MSHNSWGNLGFDYSAITVRLICFDFPEPTMAFPSEQTVMRYTLESTTAAFTGHVLGGTITFHSYRSTIKLTVALVIHHVLLEETTHTCDHG